jgi:formiminoglutamate deiminase
MYIQKITKGRASMLRAEGTIPGFHFGSALLPDGWARNVRITVSEGLIASVEPDAAPAPGDARHGAVIPGLPNLHSHAFQRAMAGLAEVRGETADSFWTWRELMYRFLDRMTPDDVRNIAAMAQVEMLETGFTRVGEFHYLHHAADGRPYADVAEMAGAIVEAAAETGIGLTLLPVFYAHSGFGGQAPTVGQRRFLHDLDGFQRLLEGTHRQVARLPDTIVGVAPHSLRAVTPVELSALAELAGDRPIHIHIAEQVKEVEDCIRWSGARPVEWLLANAPVDPRWCLVHATHVTEAEITGIAQSGAVVGLCPITEANLGDGLFPAAPFLKAGGRFGVGSDSNVRIDATEELRLLEYGQRLAARGRNLFAGGAGRSTGADLFAGALAGGAQALGVESGLRVGAAFDAVSLDLAHPSVANRSPQALLDGLIFAAGERGIDAVWRRGEQVVEGGRHRRRAAIAQRYAATLARLLA